MDAVRLLGGLVEANAMNGKVLGDLLNRAKPDDRLHHVLALFAPGTVASGVSTARDPVDGLLTSLARGGAPTTQREHHYEAAVLVQAMCCAAKADAPLSPVARAHIASRIRDLDDAAAEFLDTELASDLDVRRFARSVPTNLAHPVYAFSMLGLPADSNQQVQHLSAVAQGLDMDWIVATEIHAELGGPTIFC